MVVWCAVAAAQSAATEGGFVLLPRTDAPTDGVVLYQADHLVDITATDGDGGVETLSTTYATGDGADQLVAVTAPVGGWAPGQSYTLASTLDPAEVGPNPATLAFEVTTTAADAPLAPTVDATHLGTWTDDDVPTRTIDVDVTSADPDAWAWIDVVARFGLGQGIPDTDPRAHPDHAIGPGSHTLSFDQWLDADTGPEPPCVDVVPMSAGGVAGAPNQLCFADDTGGPADDTPSDDAGSCSCGTTSPSVGWPALLLLLTRRRGSLSNHRRPADLRVSSSPTGTTRGSSPCPRGRRSPAA
jgi:hypothetical protein